MAYMDEEERYVPETRGRPAKDEAEKVQRVTVWLRPEDLELLKKLTKGAPGMRNEVFRAALQALDAVGFKPPRSKAPKRAL
jgi:hypothetical protein